MDEVNDLIKQQGKSGSKDKQKVTNSKIAALEQIDETILFLENKMLKSDIKTQKNMDSTPIEDFPDASLSSEEEQMDDKLLLPKIVQLLVKKDDKNNSLCC